MNDHSGSSAARPVDPGATPAPLSIPAVPREGPAAALSPTSEAAGTDPWRAGAIVGLLSLVGLIALFWPTVFSMAGQWRASGAYGHGLLIAPICLYLVWHDRHRLADAPPRPSWLGLVLLLGLGAVWLLGDVAGVQIVQQVAFVAMIAALALALFGVEVVRRMAFPLFFLVFAVPFGSFLIPPMQDVTAALAVGLLQMTGIPVYIDGLLIYIPSGNFHVAEACAGVRFMISSLALGFLAAHLLFHSVRRRALFIALSVVVPIVANGLRAFGIIMIAYWSNHELAVGVDHLVYGWIFFSFITFILLGIGISFRETGPELTAAGAASGGPAPAPSGTRLVLAAAAGALCIAAVAPLYGHLIDAGRMAKPLPADLAIAVPAPWQPAEPPSPLWQPVFKGADREFSRTFAAGGQPVSVFVAYFQNQRQGAEVINEATVWDDGEHWLRIGGGRREGVVVDGRPIAVNTLLLRAGSAGRLAWSWYWVDGTFTASPFMAKVLEVRAKLLGGPLAAAAITVSTPFTEDPRTAERVLLHFLSEMEPLAAALAGQSPSAAVRPH